MLRYGFFEKMVVTGFRRRFIGFRYRTNRGFLLQCNTYENLTLRLKEWMGRGKLENREMYGSSNVYLKSYIIDNEERDS